MADQVQQFTCTVPINTPPTAPAVFNFNLGIFNVDQVDVKVPDGCNGVVGFRIATAGTQLIPFNVGAWAIFNDDYLTYPLTGQHDSGAWQLIAYNNGGYSHNLQVTFHLALLADTSSGVADPIASAALE